MILPPPLIAIPHSIPAVYCKAVITTREQEMIDLVRELVSFLSQDTLEVRDVTARVGIVAEDPGIPIPIELRPTIVGVRSAQLARYPDSGLPYLLTLNLSPDTRLTPVVLKSVLGNYHQALTDRSMPRELLFYPPREGTRWRVVVIVTLESAPSALEVTPITSILFRRDPITP